MTVRSCALGLAALTAAMAIPGDAGADLYYGCPGGFEFQVSGTAARCFKPGELQQGAHRPCLPGQILNEDYRGNADMCVIGFGTAAVVAPPGCPPGYTLRSRSGGDLCERRLDPVIQAPSVAVQR